MHQHRIKPITLVVTSDDKAWGEASDITLYILRLKAVMIIIV